MNPLFAVLSDKLAVRDVCRRNGSATTYFIPLLGQGAANDIPFDRLRPPFVPSRATTRVGITLWSEQHDGAATRASCALARSEVVLTFGIGISTG